MRWGRGAARGTRTTAERARRAFEDSFRIEAAESMPGAVAISILDDISGDWAVGYIGFSEIGSFELLLKSEAAKAERRFRTEMDARERGAYEAPVAAPELVANLRHALADDKSVHEAYLVARRITVEGRPDKRELGIAACVAGEGEIGVSAYLGNSRQSGVAFEGEAEPFVAPPDSAPLDWVVASDAPVEDEIRAVGIPLKGAAPRR